MVALDCTLSNGRQVEYEFDRARAGLRAMRQFMRRGLVTSAQLLMGKCCVAEMVNGGIIIADALKSKAVNDSQRNRQVNLS